MQKGKVLVPDGAPVEGRIRRLERYSDAGDYFIVALEFTRLETPGGALRFYADLLDVDRREGAEMVFSNTTRVEQGGFQSAGQRVAAVAWDNTSSQRIWTHEIPGVGTFFVRGSSFSLPPVSRRCGRRSFTRCRPRRSNRRTMELPIVSPAWLPRFGQFNA